MTQPASSLAHGAVLMIMMRFIDRAIGFASTLILARLLTPGDFGVVGMAMTVVALLELMGAFGFDVAIIQRQDATRVHYDTAWTMGLLWGLSAAIGLALLSYPAAQFYHEPRLRAVLVTLGLSALLQGMENIGTLNFRKELNFQREFLFLCSKRVLTFPLTVGLAYALHSYWALVIGTLFARALGTAISFIAHPYRPRLTLAARGDLFHFSKWLLISNFITFLQNKSDNFVLGRTLGSSNLGLYNVASEIAVMPSTELIAPINRAVFPIYAKLASDLPALRAKFLQVLSMIGMLALPLSFGLLLVAENAVRVLLGPQWMAAVPVLKLITLCGLTSSLQSNLLLLLVALGKPKTNTVLSAWMLVIYLPTVVWASLHYGMTGAACVHVVMSVLVLVPLTHIFLRIMGLTAVRFFGCLLRPALATAVMAVAVLAVTRSLEAYNGAPALAMLLGQMAAGAIAYTTALLTLWQLQGRPQDSAEQFILDGVAAKLARFTPRLLFK
jgi:O-antigen/teichoic acid export membrane protein